MKNNKVNNWSQEIHAVTPYISFEHIKGKKNTLAYSLLWLKTHGLYELNEPEKEGHKYGKSIFDSESETVSNIENSQKVNQTFEVDGVKYQFEEKHVDDLSLYNILGNSKHYTPLIVN